MLLANVNNTPPFFSGWNAPPSGDVEMQLVKQPATAANETLLGGEQTTEASETQGDARPVLPPRTPSMR